MEDEALNSDYEWKKRQVYVYFQKTYKIRFKGDLPKDVVYELYRKMNCLKEEAPEFYRTGYF